MAYQINRTQHVRDEIELHDGDKALTVVVDITVDAILSGYNSARARIAASQRSIDALRENMGDPQALDDATNELGSAVVALFVLLFGEEQVEKILEFYGGNHLEMLADFLPYIMDELNPKIRAAQQALAKRYTAWR